jgi:site-specific DNA-methyltransferase (adenine-specific)
MWEQLKRVTKTNGAIVLFGSQPFTSALVMSNIKMFRYEIIWEKERPTNIFFMKKQIGKVHENILVFYRKQPTYIPLMEKTNKSKGHLPSDDFSKYRNNGSLTHSRQTYQVSKDYDFTLRYPRSVCRFNRDLSSNSVRHPTQKPVALMEYLIKTYTNENETVLDFTMGSGTTGVAAKNLNRKFIGIEKDAGYFEIAKQRLCV